MLSIRMNEAIALAASLWCVAMPVSGAEAPPPLDGPTQIFRDEFLDRLAGKWRLRGTLGGEPVDHSVQVDWVLNHQFLRLHEKAGAPSKSGLLYEAVGFISRDNTSDRYVMHWIDVFGGRWSETLGYGRREGNGIEFVFEYPDGPFRSSFRWDPDAKSWHWLLRQKAPTGVWKEFLVGTLGPDRG